MSDMSKDNGSQVSGEAGEGSVITCPPTEEVTLEEISTEAFEGIKIGSDGREDISTLTVGLEKRERRGAVIAVDIDDTIAGYVQGFTKKYGYPESFEGTYENQGILKAQWPMVDLDAHFADPHHIQFCAGLLPIDGAFTSLQLLLRSGFPIVYLSARPRSHREMTVEWLNTWGFPVAPVYCTGSGDGKKMMMNNLDIAALIDDRERDLLAARDMGIATFIMDMPWNRDLPGLYRCFTWTHILEAIDMFWLPLGG